jgi:hypothetical protein
MNGKQTQIDLKSELDDEDKVYITEVFFEKIVTKLQRMDARIGTLNCDFAGKGYGNWNIHFKSRGPGFEIVDFEYDEDSFGFNLEP